VIKKILLKMSAIKANSKYFTFFECPIAPQIDSAEDFGINTNSVKNSYIVMPLID